MTTFFDSSNLALLEHRIRLDAVQRAAINIRPCRFTRRQRGDRQGR